MVTQSSVIFGLLAYLLDGPEGVPSGTSGVVSGAVSGVLKGRSAEACSTWNMAGPETPRFHVEHGRT